MLYPGKPCIHETYHVCWHLYQIINHCSLILQVLCEEHAITDLHSIDDLLSSQILSPIMSCFAGQR